MSSKEERHQRVKSLKAKANLRRTAIAKIADRMTELFGSTLSLIIHGTVFLFWLIYNSGLLLGFIAFDPYPFVFLTTAVSIEAIFLSIFVLISQNRQTQIADLREEVVLQIALESEEEITKVLQLLDQIRHRLGIEKRDSELISMEKRLDAEKIALELESEIEKAD